MEGIQNDAVTVPVKAQQKMTRKPKAFDSPPLRTRHMNVENSERNGQPFAPVDHTHQIGILQIVISLVIAPIAKVFGQHPLQRALGVEGGARRWLTSDTRHQVV